MTAIMRHSSKNGQIPEKPDYANHKNTAAMPTIPTWAHP